MYRLTASRLVQISSCGFQKVPVNLGNVKCETVSEVMQYIHFLGFEECEQQIRPESKNLFFFARSHKRYPIGNKYNELSFMAIAE